MTDSKRKDLLIPMSKSVLKPNKVDLGRNNELIWDYLWREGDSEHDAYAEFVKNDKLITDAKLPQGILLDRVGGETGSYMCIVPKNGYIYSLSERSLPYHLKGNLKRNASYHIYKVLKEISFSSLKEDARFRQNYTLTYTGMVNNNFRFIEGEIAPVKAFGEQGKGGGLQVRFPDSITVKILVELEYLEEILKMN